MINKTILILGGTGALGKTLVKKYHNDNTIIVFSRDEHKHYHLLQEYSDVISVIGDIKDKDTIMNAILRYKPEVIINAAALKHVPVCEDNPYESVKTNIIGHQNVIECANLYSELESLIFVSTDKACKPINVYGMCKAISEQLYISYAKQQKDTKVVIVRYGNVLESTGSVIPFFKDLLENNASTLPITDDRMTRFLLTLEEATDLIEWAYQYNDSHGKIAVPKVKSLKVTDIANALIKNYGVDVSLKVIGIRAGEKLHEEMVSFEEWRKTEELDNFFLIGNDVVSSDHHSYNSLDYLMDSSEAYNFLKISGVL
tara:strand:- start:9327 stop:10268 length:942 start_codon:yes stop_codon:yes gene_type:complete